MEIEHSRLLKFIVTNNSKMEKHTLQIEDLAPSLTSNIECEVPGQQKIREETLNEPIKELPTKRIEPENVSDGKLILKQGDTVETYAPVITVKTVESNFGKDGLRFEKKTVTEDISVHFQHLFKKETKPGKTVEGQIEWTDLRDMIKKPVYMGLQEEVIRAPHQIRVPKTNGVNDNEAEKITAEAERPQTRIPVSRFKPVVERVLKARNDAPVASTHKNKREAPEKPRRSSIPKLKDRVHGVKKNPPTDDSKLDNTDNDPVNESKDKLTVKSNLKRAIRKDKIPVMSRESYKITKKCDEGKRPDKLIEKENISQEKTPAINHTNDSVKTDTTEMLDDEFDKLYDEIVDHDGVSLPDEILETKVKDPEKLEIKFEEIVHQYDEQPVEEVKIEPVNKARYSKIPLLRRRSSNDVNVPRQYERRLSLKTTNINRSTPVKDTKSNDSKNKTKHDDESNNVSEDNIVQVSEDTVIEPTQNGAVIEINNNDENNEDRYALMQSPDAIPDYNTIATPDSELVKVGIFGISRNISLEDNQNLATPEPETVKVAVIDIPAEEPLKYIENDIKLVEAECGHIIDEVHDDTIKEEIDAINDDNAIKTETIKENVVSTDIPAEEPLKYIENDIKLVEPECAHIIDEEHDDTLKDEIDAINDDNTIKTETIKEDVVGIDMPAEEPLKYIENDFKLVEPECAHIIDEEHDDILKEQKDAINDDYTTKTETIKEDVFVNTPPPCVFVHANDELKSLNLLKNTNTIEERTKSRYINKPPREEANSNNVAKLEEDIPTIKGKVNRILRRLTSQEHPNNEANTNNIDEDIVDTRKEINDIPKKKSVLSKIAMFERADPEPSLPKKPTHKYSKPTRTISEEIKHGPKIVEEVLKPKGVPTDQHTIATVDILRPVEVISNNEEQVTIVENLKEDTVSYNNFDDARLNETNAVEFGSGILSDTSVNYDKHNNCDEFKDRIEYSEAYDENKIDKENRPKEKIFSKDNHYQQTPLDSSSNIDKKEKWKSIDALRDYLPVKEKINRLISHEGSNNMKRAKSTAELDLGDAVKGKVKQMIVRMNSCEMLDGVKPKEVEVISAKERPRKRSVSEKIALFEKKLTPVAMDNVKVDSGSRALTHDSKPVKDSPNAIPTANATNEELAAKIKELKNAKLTYGSVGNMSYVQLKDGNKMPVIALGTALLDPSLTKHIVAAAIDLGYRAIDTAFIYGNEREVGEGIRAKLQDGTVRREDLFIMNKMWSTYHRPDLVEPACRASLAATGLDYFDLYMIHNPMSLKEGGDPLPKIANVLQFSEYDYLDAWFAMEPLLAKGLVRSIGVSNFNSEQLARVLEKGRVKPVFNQVECHPYLTQQRLSDFCDARDVQLSCFGVLGSKGTPAEFKGSQDAAIDDPLVKVMAAGLGITPAQLLIRYQIDSGHAVVVKASTVTHLWDNLQALNVTLEAAQVAAIKALNKNKRSFTFKGMGDTHRNYPFKIAF